MEVTRGRPADPALALEERDYNHNHNQPIPHVSIAMPVPTIKIKNRPFSPDAIRRLISLKRHQNGNGSGSGGSKRPWTDRTSSEPIINTTGVAGAGAGAGISGTGGGQGGLEASGQLKSLHFDDLGLDFDDLDWK